MSVTGIVRLIGIKALELLPVLVAVSVMTFGAMSLIPGDPVTVILGNSASAETRELLREQLGLNLPLVDRYVTWVTNAIQGNLGVSYVTRIPVAASIAQRLPVTVELILVSQVLALGVSIPLGVWTAYRAGSVIDRVSTVGAFAMIAFPPFVLAVLLSSVFAAGLGWFPTTGFVSLGDPIGNARSIALPVIALAAGSGAVYLRLLRTEMARTLEQDFILVARAKGLSTSRILIGHALRPSSFPLVTVVSLTLGGLIGGALVIEIIYGLPGIGRLLYDAISRRDYIVIQGVVAFIAIAYVILNFVLDVMYAILDPRLREG